MAGDRVAVEIAKPRLPHWFITGMVPIGITLLFTLYLKPSVIPFDHLGRFGDFLSYLDQQKTIVFCQFVFTCFAHTSEALYSLILTRKYNLNASETIQWFILVLVYGMFCLRYLKPVKDKTT